MTRLSERSFRTLMFWSEHILRTTSEEWLEFSAGQNTQFNLARFRANPVTSAFKQITSFAYFLMVSFGIRIHQAPQKDVLFFASSRNQYSVLQPVYKESVDISKVFVVPRVFISKIGLKQETVVVSRLSLRYVVPVLLLLVKRTPHLLKTLFTIDKRLLVFRLKSFWSIYFWLVHHQVLLDYVRPKIVMLSNDHNPEARTLIELCKIRGIKTGYIPHAGVSSRFHSLDFDYNFLDGEHAMSIYRKCDARRSPDSTIIPRRQCFLVGNLRKVVAPNMPISRVQRYGLAVKGTDAIASVKTTICRLSAHAPVVVRPHPNLNASTYLQLLKDLEVANVELSDPSVEGPAAFLAKITTLVSGNSTLLLEAASAGRVPVYLGALSAGVHDYYGYVSRRVADYHRDVEDLLSSQTSIDESSMFRADEDGIRYYWSSFNTPFENLEAIIIGDFLSQILRGVEELESEFDIEISELKKES